MRIIVQNQRLKVKLNRDELTYFVEYLIKCYDLINDNEESQEDNKHFPINRRAQMIDRFIHAELINLFVKKYTSINPFQLNINININEVQQNFLSILFKNYSADAFILQIQERFIKNLIKIN